MKKGTIFLDLDGTILDVFERSYRAYKDILSSIRADAKTLGKDEYIRLKREKTPLRDILQKTGADAFIGQFEELWSDKIESDSYLEFDKMIPGAKNSLSSIKDDFELVLVTLRDNKENLFKELKNKGLEKIFEQILVVSGKNIKDKYELKSNLIKSCGTNRKKCIIVGDTETDILAGKNSKIKTVAVCGGMRSRVFLEKYGPDNIIDDITHLKEIV